MTTTANTAQALMMLLQFTDSTFPVGSFSFSNGLETAAYEKIVRDAPTLEQFARASAGQAAFTDGVAALHAHRAAATDDYDALARADRALTAAKMNAEARLMLSRMGRKLAELGVSLFPDRPMPARWLADIGAGRLPGNYPVAQGILFHAAGLGEEELFCSHQYGVINMILGAALRLVRVSHIGNQHWPAVVKGTKVYVPLTVDRKVMLSVLDTHHIEGITYTFEEGTEVIPYLAPHEVRRLFGGAGHESHSHTHADPDTLPDAAPHADGAIVEADGRRRVITHDHGDGHVHTHTLPDTLPHTAELPRDYDAEQYPHC